MSRTQEVLLLHSAGAAIFMPELVPGLFHTNVDSAIPRPDFLNLTGSFSPKLIVSLIYKIAEMICFFLNAFFFLLWIS